MGTEEWGLVAIGGFLAFCANVFYMWGGTEGFDKWWRRFVGAFTLAYSANIIAIYLGSWSWQYLLFFPCFVAGFSLGYGGATTPEKIAKRVIYSLCILLSCVAGLFATGFSGAGLLVAGLAVLTGLTSVVLGVFNPFNSARVEEFIIAQVLTLYIPFWAYIK